MSSLKDAVHTRYRQWIFIGMAFAAIALLVLLWFLYFNTTVYRTAWGFFPSSITVSEGETVTFVNLTNMAMWPASDVHPHHTVYSAFDPKRNLAPGERWSFTFENSGTWLFHDHISTQFGGVVRVLDEHGEASFDCSGDNAQACWVAVLNRTIREEGLEATYDAFVDIHQNNPEFATQCHNYVHDIGLKTYIYYGTDFELTPKTSYCNAGFFHGFVEGLISNVDDLSEASAFCDRVKDELEETFPLADEQCRHGIGHGILEHFILTRPDLLSSPELLLREAVAVCEATNESYDHLMRCASGAYNVYRDFIGSNETFGEYAKKENLYKVCALASERYEKEACYWELSKIMTRINSVDEIIADVEQTGSSDAFDMHLSITESDRETYAPFAVRSWAFILGKYAVSDAPADLVLRVCDSVPDFAQQSCLKGVYEGAFSSSEPHEEHKVFDALCTSTELNEDEQSDCYHQFQKEVLATYSVAEFNRQCEIVPERYEMEGVCG